MPEPINGDSVVKEEANTSVAAPEATADETSAEDKSSEPEAYFTDDGELRFKGENGEDTDEQPEGEATDTDNTKEASDDDKPRSENARVRDLVAEKNRTAEENARLAAENSRNETLIEQIVSSVSAKNAEVYGGGEQPTSIPTVEEIMYDEADNPRVNPETGEYYTKQEAQWEFLMNRENAAEQNRVRQESVKSLETANRQIAENQIKLESEAQQVFKDFPVFDPESVEYNAEFAGEVADILAANLVYDDNTGVLLGANVSPYKLYASYAKAFEMAKTTGQTNGQRAAEKMMARVDDLDGSGSRKPGKDFDNLSAEEMEKELERQGVQLR